MAIRRPRALVRAFGAAAVALVVAAGPAAQSASAADLSGFSGAGNGFALRVVVDLSGLPAAVKAPIETAYDTFRGALPAVAQAKLPAAFPFVLDQRVIETLVEMGSKEQAQAFLSRGLVNFPDVAKATKKGDSNKVATAAKKVPSDDLPVLNASVGELLASVADGPNVSGKGTLASVSASLEQISALFPAELQTAFGDLTTAINGAVATAQTTLNTTLGTIASSIVSQVPSNPTLAGLLDQAGLGGVLSNPDPVGDLTTQLTNALQLSTITDLLAGPVASINGLRNEATAVKSDGKASSDSLSKITSVNLLGLLSANAIDLKSHSEAGGTSGSAKNTSSCSIANVKVGGSEGIGLDGKTIYVAGTAIPVPVGQVSALKSVADGVLSTLGIVGKVGLCDKEATADADGSSAAQRVSALHVELSLAAPAAVGQLIGAGDQLVRIIVDPTIETAAAAQVAAAAPVLPKTGAPIGATVLSGIALVGAAMFLRRRLA